MISSVHIIGSKRSGGAEQFYGRLVRALHEQHHPVLAINPPGSLVADDLAADVPQTHIPMRGAWDVLSRWQISRRVAAAQPDIVQTYMGRATRLTHLHPQGVRPVHVARLGGYYDLKGYRHAHAWVGNTRGICDYLVRHGLPADRVFYVGNFVDPAPLITPAQRIRMREAWGIPLDALAVLAVGRLHPAKGMEDLLAAFSRLPSAIHERPIYLTIVGDGPLRDQLAQYSAQLPAHERIRWAGWQTDVMPFYAQADVFVCPSRHEPLGNVILEAWAHRLPVVSTQTLGASELITHGANGLLTPCADSPALAAVLLDVLTTHDKACKTLGMAGYETLLHNYSKEAVVKAYLVLYDTLLGRL